jgi:hypothetical protein
VKQKIKIKKAIREAYKSVVQDFSRQEFYFIFQNTFTANYFDLLLAMATCSGRYMGIKYWPFVPVIP